MHSQKIKKKSTKKELFWLKRGQKLHRLRIHKRLSTLTFFWAVGLCMMGLLFRISHAIPGAPYLDQISYLWTHNGITQSITAGEMRDFDTKQNRTARTNTSVALVLTGSETFSIIAVTNTTGQFPSITIDNNAFTLAKKVFFGGNMSGGGILYEDSESDQGTTYNTGETFYTQPATIDIFWIDTGANFLTASVLLDTNNENTPGGAPGYALIILSGYNEGEQASIKDDEFVITSLGGPFARNCYNTGSNSGNRSLRNNSIVVMSNGVGSINYKDRAGNTGTKLVPVSGLTPTQPPVTITYSTTTSTTSPVTATISSACSTNPITITNNGGSNTISLATNGSFTFQFEDDFEYTGSATATVNRITSASSPTPPSSTPSSQGGGGGGGGTTTPTYIAPLTNNTGTIQPTPIIPEEEPVHNAGDLFMPSAEITQGAKCIITPRNLNEVEKQTRQVFQKAFPDTSKGSERVEILDKMLRLLQRKINTFKDKTILTTTEKAEKEMYEFLQLLAYRRQQLDLNGTSRKNRSPSQQEVVDRMYKNKLTAYSTIEGFNPNAGLNRQAAAKFLTEFAEQFACIKPIRSEKQCQFTDINTIEPTLRGYVIKSCQLGIFKGYPDGRFAPFETFDFNQASVVIIRTIFGEMAASSPELRAQPYIDRAQNASIALPGAQAGSKADRFTVGAMLLRASRYW